MPAQQPDFEKYAQTLQQVMADAIARAETLQVEAAAERDAAHAIDEKRRDTLRAMENKAQRTAEDEAPQLYKQMKKDILATVVAKIKNSDRSDPEKAVLLEALESDRR